MNTLNPWSSVPIKLRGLTLVLLTTLVTFAPSVSMAVDARASKYYEVALVRYEKKDPAGAIIQMKNALQIDKSMLPVQMLLGKALLQSGDVVAAEVALSEALRLGVSRVEVVSRLGKPTWPKANKNSFLSSSNSV